MYTVEELINILKGFDPKSKVSIVHDQCDVTYKIECVCEDEDPDATEVDTLIVVSRVD